MDDKDKTVLRALAGRIAEIGNLPIQKEKADLWRRLNGLERTRPLVFICEIPWHEMNVNDELTPRCEGDAARELEQALRRLIYQWDHMPGDMVVDPEIPCHYVIHDTGYGVDVDSVRSEASGITAADYVPVLQNEDDIARIKDPVITVDWDATERNYQAMCETFGDILPVRKTGVGHRWFAVWDQLIQWYGITELYMDMLDRPDFVHMAAKRMSDAMIARLDQYQQLGVLSVSNGNHRVGSGGLGITDKLPQSDYDGVHARTIDQWGCATGQIFSEVSPEMHAEFCLKYELPWLERFGLNYYGCCEPLQNKIDMLRSVPRLRKISISPQADVARAAEQMRRDFVLSRKPNPAMVATERWHPDQVRQTLTETLETTRDNVVEIILKDITTVRGEPQRLWEWSEIAMEVVQEF